MRTRGVPAAALLLVLVSLVIQASRAEDIYWEGEEDTSNEFLEVKEEDNGISGHLKRIKKGIWDFWDLTPSSTTTEAPENIESYTEDRVDEENPDEGSEDLDNDGSGLPESRLEEPKEKTIRVTFVVMEPYRAEYSNRDSSQFQNFSRSLADAVNVLYDELQGIQRASLVRIQSRVSDNFSCNVTLDIVTSGYEDTDRITQILRDHIKDNRKLGSILVNDAGFSATLIDPGPIAPIDNCAVDELQCDDGRCVPGFARCNGVQDCSDGSDEADCPLPDEFWTGQGQDQSTSPPYEPSVTITETPYETDETDTTPSTVFGSGITAEPWASVICDEPCQGSFITICPSQRCDGKRDCPNGDDELECSPPPPGPGPDPGLNTVCREDELTCDETRCVPKVKRCDGINDCYDGTDEAGCRSSPDQELCGMDDFTCDNGRCIESRRACDRVVDCPNGEDEKNCTCRSDEFRCEGDGFCIESRKRCDGINHCNDNSDEVNCACSSDHWQCDHGSCIKRSKRCDGRVDCPTDRSDERNCMASTNGYFRCRSGNFIAENLRCNRQYDCPTGDYSDEQNCPCGDGDFKCDNGHCIPASKRCDRTHDCQDGSDERDCSYDTICMAYEYECSNGQCIRSEGWCNGTNECTDGSDENDCPCKRGEFQCRDGTCVNLALRCNGLVDCIPDGEDEHNCGTCPYNIWQCNDGTCISMDKRCDGRFDCRDRSDERSCLERNFFTKDASRCPPDSFTCRPESSRQCAKMCDGTPECDGGEDEDDCPDCNHECDGRCIEDSKICDGVPDCSDASDEAECYNCDGPTDFRCNNGQCLNIAQKCNNMPDCLDNSDEDNCTSITAPPKTCAEDQYTCHSGICIDNRFVCDGHADCDDNSDEENCPWYMARSSRSPVEEPCHESEFTCYDGRCIPHARRCDNIYDCMDFSDEQNCHNSGCAEEEYQCRSGQCIPNTNRCDGYNDCADRSDENDCPTPPPEFSPRPPTTATPAPGPNYPPYITYSPAPNYPLYTTTQSYVPPEREDGGRDTYGGYGDTDGCDRNQWRCENGPCIDARLRCDGRVDCPHDTSDELDCLQNSQPALNLKTYPDQQTIRYGGDVVFQCRDEGSLRAPVRWVREGGRPLKPGAVDRNGRLELNGVTPADSGVYICQAPRYLGSAGAELRVQLTVESAAATSKPPFGCQPYEATCGNGQCIPKSAVCDGRYDCADRSDEDACNQNGMCEPNQYQCANRRCVLKTWLCDSENDCGDGSDEQNCGQSQPGEPCLVVEFACASQDQCVPKSFHCDGQSDCFDGSDEIGCAPVYVTKPPQPANLRLNPGETLSLTCEAVGVPTPLITWRLNWGHVPEKCSSTSVNGVGTLTCPNMQYDDSGAYSCEAINNKGTTFGAPDAIVYVNRTDVCRNGYFNSEANTENECIRCFCFGKSTQCHSADLFTYNMPTPLGEGGTRLVGLRPTYTGELELDTQPVTDQYYYQPLRNGATVTKLVNYGSWTSNVLPYLTLPETYNGNQLTSYGGRIKYKLSPHAQRYGYNNLPDIVIKGKYETLVYYTGRDNSRETTIEARLTPENWQKTTSNGPVPATREDIMMALDNIEMILLRAGLNDAGVNITDFAMESAQHINMGLGSASLVEECVCPPGYEGLSCQKCASGYVREKSGLWLGDCVRERKECPAGTYGDPNNGVPCQTCPCPLTNRENQFARTCSLGSNGGVICDCLPGYEGSNCERCAPGFVGNPWMPGDYCQQPSSDNCNTIGTDHVRLPDDCQCKDNVQGRYCDECKNGSFYLNQDFRHGCALCFCSGVSQQCTSSNLRRKATTVRFNVPQIVDQVKIYNSAPTGPSGSIRYNAPIETNLRPQLIRGELLLRDIQPSTIYYWSLPASFAGDKVTSYGGHLIYTLQHVPLQGGQTSANNAADVQLISDNRLTFHYFGNFAPSNDGSLNASVQFLEKGWQRPDGKEVSREHFLLALADVKAILVKGTYTASPQVASIESATIETAEPNGNGPMALHVEQCVCPTGYVGSSCEDCAPGYTRSASGLYLEHCDLCDCNGHSTMCHPETGVCYDCADNTAGDNCEQCKPGYERDQYQNCVLSYGPPTTCNCDPRGIDGICDSSGYCRCKVNVEGDTCDRCRAGTFGLDADNPEGCSSCYCSGVSSDCYEASHYSRIPIPAPIIGDNYGGYNIQDLNAEEVINDQFVPATNESELMYVFTFPPSRELYWSLPVFPGNRILSYGGSLSLTQKFQSSGYLEESTPGNDVVLIGDDESVYWSNPERIRAGEPLTYQVPLRENGWYILGNGRPARRPQFLGVLKNLKRVLVRATLTQSVSLTAIADVSMDTATELSSLGAKPAKGVEICICPEGHTGTSCESCTSGYYSDQLGYCRQCNCNGHDCQLGAYDEVICNCRPPYTGPDCSIIEKEPATTSRPPISGTVIVRITSPTIKIQELGSTVNFTCEAQSVNTRRPLVVHWTKADGELPQGRAITDNSGLLLITNVQVSDSGKYICQTSDGVSTGQAIATLRVPGNNMRLPIVEIRPPVNEYSEGDTIQLECVAEGNPAPRITWQRSSGRPLPYAAAYNEAFLVIENVREDDSGEYRCIATNAAGSTDRTAVVVVRPRATRPSGRLSVSPSSLAVTEGQHTRAICTGDARVPAGSIGWTRQDDTALAPNVRSDNGVLTISVATTDNQGVYVCQTSAPGVTPVLLYLQVVPLSTPAPAETSNITVPVKQLRIPTGGSGSVDCVPQGYPLPLIKWTRYQGTFGPGTSQRDNTLVISSAERDDQGYYVCEGRVDGSLVANIYVFVEVEEREAPRVEIWPRGEQAVPLNGQFELHCRVMAGAPEPAVVWSRAGGRPLSSHAQILPQHVLKFEQIEVNDEGEYTCSATNVAGTDNASATLRVWSPPEIRISPSTFVEVLRGDPINIECRATGYPEPMVTIKAGPEQREVVPPTPGAAVLRVASAGARDDDDYVCIAVAADTSMQESFAIRVDRSDAGLGDFGGSGEEEFSSPAPYPSNPYDNQPRSHTAINGQETRLICTAPYDAEARWSRGDGRPLQPNAFQRDNELIIYNTSKSDEGQYECMIIDRRTNEHQQSKYTSLRVVAAPTITLRPPTQTVHPGQSPTVECVVEGDEIIEITWRPVDRPLSSRVETRNSVLIFHQIEVEDAGKYECFTRNRVANASAVAEVIVSEDAGGATESRAKEQRARAGAGVVLQCRAPSVGVRVAWRKDGGQLPRGVRTDRDGSLHIARATAAHSGRYECLVRDSLGRTATDYVQLHVEVIQCLESQFRCNDYSSCLDEDLLCDGYRDCEDNSDEENCMLRDDQTVPPFLEPAFAGPRDVAPSLVSIDQPRSPFRVGDNVEVLCRASSRGTRVSWERYGTNQYVQTTTYGDGSQLIIHGVEESDAGVYRCIGRDSYDRTTGYEDFTLIVHPGPSYPSVEGDVTYTAQVNDAVDLPCTHNLEQPVTYEWRREYVPLPSEVRTNEPTLHLEGVTEKDAGAYVCRVSGPRAAVEARAVLLVRGVLPRFDGDSWIALPALKDAFRQINLEISFKPTDGNGLILYNSEKQGRTGDYLALQLIDGIPQFVLEMGNGPVIVSGDRPLQLNTWHTIMVKRVNSKVTMDVDNTGPFVSESPGHWDLLDLAQPLYIGGVPDYDQLPSQLAGASGFLGCVSMLIIDREEKNIILDSLEKYRINECDSCAPNQCLNNGICQEARNERGFVCVCAGGFAGVRCERTGAACRPGLCGVGTCRDTPDGYACRCPVNYTGRNCEIQQSIEYPAFTGSAYLAIKPPPASRTFRMAMKIKASQPVTDGIIMYCAESPRGWGGFTSLAVRDGRLEFRFDLGDGNGPVILTSSQRLEPNEWTDVTIVRIGDVVTLQVNVLDSVKGKLMHHDKKRDYLNWETPMYVGGVDDSITLNNNTGVTGGFNGCIKDVIEYENHVDIVNSSILSANVQECSNYDRGDIPESESVSESLCASCRNRGYCASAEATACTCPSGFTGRYCEVRAGSTAPSANPCRVLPCRNGGSCRFDSLASLNYSCDCPLGYGGTNCQMSLELYQSVSFNGNGYLILPAERLYYDRLEREPAVIALRINGVTGDGVLLYQYEASASPGSGDYVLLRVERGVVVLDWDLGGGYSTLSLNSVYVNDGERHAIIVKLLANNEASLSVDGNSKTGQSTGFSNLMNADSYIYIGGIPDHLNVQAFPGLSGCVEQLELMDTDRGLNLGEIAISAKNAQRCKNSPGY